MTQLPRISLLICSLLLALQAHAISDAAKAQIASLVEGGPHGIKRTASTIYKTGSAEVEVTDALAEVLLQNHMQSSGMYIDALSWAAKALGKSQNGRYRDVLLQVADSGAHKKLRKYAKVSLKPIKKSDAQQYVKGSFDLAAYKNMKPAPPPAPIQGQTKSSGQYSPITAATQGMSMEEVYALCGVPTSSRSYQTGKAWKPFNFKGADTVRLVGLYKGQGRVIFSKSNAYTTVWRVLKVELNPNESGYP